MLQKCKYPKGVCMCECLCEGVLTSVTFCKYVCFQVPDLSSL